MTDRLQGPVANSIAVAQPNINDRVTQKSSIGIEAGAVLLYDISKKLRVKAGLQYNYSNYISYATYLGHSTTTTMTVLAKDGTSHQEEKASIYLNSANSRNDNILNNTTSQVSIPLGIDYKIAGGRRLGWYAGTTIQPGVLVGGNAFGISSDNQYFINENSLLRRTNVNASAETFLSYRTGKQISITAGPEVRYQLLSTYKSSYNYSEKLYNFGVKVGLVKHF